MQTIWEHFINGLLSHFVVTFYYNSNNISVSDISLCLVQQLHIGFIVSVVEIVVLVSDGHLLGVTQNFIHVDIQASVAPIVAVFMLDLVKVVASVINLTVEEGLHVGHSLGVVPLGVPGQDAAGPPVSEDEEQVDVLTSADQSIVVIVGVEDDEV